MTALHGYTCVEVTISALEMLQEILPLSELYFLIIEGSLKMLIFPDIPFFFFFFLFKKIGRISFSPKALC